MNDMYTIWVTNPRNDATIVDYYCCCDDDVYAADEYAAADDEDAVG